MGSDFSFIILPSFLHYDADADYVRYVSGTWTNIGGNTYRNRPESQAPRAEKPCVDFMAGFREVRSGTLATWCAKCNWEEGAH